MDIDFLFQTRQIWPTCHLECFSFVEICDVLSMPTLGFGRIFKVLGQTFIQPHGNILQYAVEGSMGEFMSEIFPEVVSPKGVDAQFFTSPGVDMGHEVCTAVR